MSCHGWQPVLPRVRSKAVTKATPAIPRNACGKSIAPCLMRRISRRAEQGGDSVRQNLRARKRSARFTGGDIAARCPYQHCCEAATPPILLPWKSHAAKPCRTRFHRGLIRKRDLFHQHQLRRTLQESTRFARSRQTTCLQPSAIGRRSSWWWPYLFLLMPDHLHALLSFPPSGKPLKSVVSKWKEWTAKGSGIVWQRDFFEHRLRHDESRREKVDYILRNPHRKKLVAVRKTGRSSISATAKPPSTGRDGALRRPRWYNQRNVSVDLSHDSTSRGLVPPALRAGTSGAMSLPQSPLTRRWHDTKQRRCLNQD